MSVTVVILTVNEARHIERALRSVAAIADVTFVVDSGSTDRTVEIARAMGAEVLTHLFVNQAQQFNWALDQLPADTDWVLRLDADEVVSSELAGEITARLPALPEEVAGLTLPRRIAFLGRPIRYGGCFPGACPAAVPFWPGTQRGPLDGRTHRRRGPGRGARG